MEYPNLSGDEFKKIVNLFKLIVTLVSISLTVIVSTSLYFSFKDVSSMKTEIREKTTDMKLEVSQLREFSQQEIKNAQDYSIKQISLIKEEAAIQAKLTARLKIQEIFEDNKKIREMIEETAEKRLYSKLNEFLDQQLAETEKILKNQVEIIPELISAVDRIRAGSRDALEFIDSLQVNSEKASIKDLANTIYQFKKEDYAKTYESAIDSFFIENLIAPSNSYLYIPTLLQIQPDKKKWINKTQKDEILLPKLIAIIRQNKDLNNVAAAFYAIMKLEPIKLDLFNFKDFELKIKPVEERIKNKFFNQEKYNIQPPHNGRIF